MNEANTLPRSTPEHQGISSTAVLGFVDALDRSDQELHSMMLLRHGEVVAEGWWSPYRAQDPQMLFSLSKSFTSTAIGLAVDEGRLSLDDSVISFFPDDAPRQVGENLAAVQVRHLLTMTTGHVEDTLETLDRAEDGNWAKVFLALPVDKAPGSHFVYNSGASYLLSAIVQRVTGTTMLEYLRPRLLDPLGLTEATWEVSPQGISSGGWGLNLMTESVARFGQLYLQGGAWHGEQVVPEAWVAEATSYQVSTDSRDEVDWRQGYGYQFWRCRHGAHRADGAFGQYCIVLPDQDAVLVIIGAADNMQAVLDVVWDRLLPALHGGEALPPDQPGAEQLSRRLTGLTLAPPRGASSPSAANAGDRAFTVDANELELDSVRFEPAGATFRFGSDGGSQDIVCGAGRWQQAPISLPRHGSWVVASGVWQDEVYVATFRFPETPFCYTLSCRLDGDRLTVDVTVNVSFGPTRYTLTGSAA